VAIHELPLQAMTQMETYYPIFVNIKGKDCVVVGGGRVAERKVKTLLEYGASVKIISPTLTTGLQKLAARRIINWIDRPYVEGDLSASGGLVIAASNNQKINKAVFEEAESKGCLVNVVDKPVLCRFIVPATISSGGITLAFSSGGKSPAVIKKLKTEIEDIMPRYARLLKLVAQVRRNYVGKGLKPQAWSAALDGTLESLLEEGKMKEARKLLKERLDAQLR